jgi:hypothetical protein
MSKTAMPTCFRFLSVAVLAVPVLAEEPAVGVVDKSQFHLFNPTPKALMRELSTDRPDQTESPYTVDAMCSWSGT